MLTQEQLIKITKIMGLSVLINDSEKYCTFVNFSGHVDNIDIRIRKSKKKYTEPVADCSFYTLARDYDKYNTIDDRLDEILITLQELLTSEKIPYEYLREVERIEYDYEF